MFPRLCDDPLMPYEAEYDPYTDEQYGNRPPMHIDWAAEGEPWLAVYMEKLAKKWPANMAAVAANKATGRKAQ